MLENINTSPNSRDDGAGTPENYLSRAVAACEAGDARLGLHLYLAAFEQAAEQSDAPSEDAIMGLKQAWRVACSTKERALAEYIFERPAWSSCRCSPWSASRASVFPAMISWK